MNKNKEIDMTVKEVIDNYRAQSEKALRENDEKRAAEARLLSTRAINLREAIASLPDYGVAVRLLDPEAPIPEGYEADKCAPVVSFEPMVEDNVIVCVHVGIARYRVVQWKVTRIPLIFWTWRRYRRISEEVMPNTAKIIEWTARQWSSLTSKLCSS